MTTVLDIDLDFFTSPIVNDSMGEVASRRRGETVEATDEVLDYLKSNLAVPIPERTPGGVFEHHDEVFEFALRHFTEPVHLIHVDAHSDIGGGLPMCWQYVFGDYLHLNGQGRHSPERGPKGLNCGNFIVFLAACGLLERVTFVTREDWRHDYSCIYMTDFCKDAGSLQLKCFNKQDFSRVGLGAELWDLPHSVESAIPFEVVGRDGFSSRVAPDMLLVTRSPQYTPECADQLFDALFDLVDPLPTDH
jgi:hypothetical protein